jgi:hypothetical protein
MAEAEEEAIVVRIVDELCAVIAEVTQEAAD